MGRQSLAITASRPRSDCIRTLPHLAYKRRPFLPMHLASCCRSPFLRWQRAPRCRSFACRGCIARLSPESGTNAPLMLTLRSRRYRPRGPSSTIPTCWKWSPRLWRCSDGLGFRAGRHQERPADCAMGLQGACESLHQSTSLACQSSPGGSICDLACGPVASCKTTTGVVVLGSVGALLQR